MCEMEKKAKKMKKKHSTVTWGNKRKLLKRKKRHTKKGNEKGSGKENIKRQERKMYKIE